MKCPPKFDHKEKTSNMNDFAILLRFANSILADHDKLTHGVTNYKRAKYTVMFRTLYNYQFYSPGICFFSTLSYFNSNPYHIW